MTIEALEKHAAETRLWAEHTESPELERRVAYHAALADPLRLRVVDMLAHADLSSSELRSAVDASSNLLAHHLGVLERAGIIRRRRSEGDRRRSYVQLLPGVLRSLVPVGDSLPSDTGDAGLLRSLRELAAAPRSRPAGRLLFICRGNSARSPFAAALWNHIWGPSGTHPLPSPSTGTPHFQGSTSSIPAYSAGTHPASGPSRHAVDAARQFGVDLSEHSPAPVGKPRPGDVVVAVCDRAHEDLCIQHGHHWSVPNPGKAGTHQAYETAFTELAHRIEALSRALSPVKAA